ncbi:MAG TPA: tetratricopeptide repeat-containing protein kinase family protein, partial [Thermoanaerobaculia bacterium]|nr:tetratricopeptide repeat-containing protein kinase family protein [Thermoanaerobaculia bacterium]
LDQASITRTGQTVGTWSYMAPEQIQGEEVTSAADLWSLGIVLFELVTGRRPFRARSEPDLISKILETEAPPLRGAGPRLAQIVARALEKSPQRRYASAREMQEDLLLAADALAGREPETAWREQAVPVVREARVEPPFLHNLPFPPLGELLKGRSEELQALARTLSENQTLVLHGLGGIGKTRLAIEYAWRFGRRYPAALFVLADSPDGLNSGLAALARADLLDLPERTRPAESEVVAAVLKWLRTNPGWLLILDNVDTREARLAVARLLPSLAAGRVLITSRRRDWPAGIHRRHIDHIRLQPAAEFLLERTGEDRRQEPDDPEQALRLAELLDGLPLALEQAAAYIVHRQVSFREYLDAWEAESDSVLGWYDEGAMQYPASLAITWQRTLHELSPTARSVLRLVSFLAPDPVPAEMIVSGEEVVRRAAALLGEETGQDGQVRLVRGEIAELRSLSLISGQGDLFAMHRLMQEVVRKQIPPERRPAWIELAVELIDRFAPDQPDDAGTWPVWDLLRPHVAELLAHREEYRVADSVDANRLRTYLAVLLLGKGLNEEAEPILLEVLKLDRARYGDEHVEVASDLSNLALGYKAMGRLEEAERLMRQAVRTSRTCDKPLVLSKQLNGLALILMERQGWAEAEELLRESLAIDNGLHQRSVARDLHNLALLLFSTGRSAEGEPVIRRSLELAQEVHGSDHPLTARKMHILAWILRDLGQQTQAEPLVRGALEIYERILGPEHPRTLSARRDLEALSKA